MKLIRFGETGKEKPGVIMADGTRRDVSALVTEYDETFFGSDGISNLEHWIAGNENNLPIVSGDVRLGPPCARPSKLICIGLNYSKHAKESGAVLPPEPVIFFKATTAVTGPNDDIIIPKNSVKTDWEVELAVVIGKRASYVEEIDAPSHIAGYVLHNDVSEREFQMERSGQWVKGKSADSFAPLGPFIATADEVADPGNLPLWLKVNGTTMQSSNTSDLIFKIPYLVSYISQFMTLLPGDIISTGTPAGVGLGLRPPRYLCPGDVVELGIDGLGTATQHVVAWRAL
jgi:2,4-didehydro-3-deoxy-L-rhamnonate hydrolase